MVVASTRFAPDELKATAFISIAEKAKAADAKKVPLAFCINPAEVRTTGQVPKGKLELVPATMINNMTNKKPVGAKGIEAVGEEFSLSDKMTSLFKTTFKFVLSFGSYVFRIQSTDTIVRFNKRSTLQSRSWKINEKDQW